MASWLRGKKVWLPGCQERKYGFLARKESMASCLARKVCMASWRGKKVWLPSWRGKYGLWLPGKEAISLHPLRPAASRCVPLRPLRPLRPRASAASGCVRLRPAASYVGSDIERIYAEMGALDALTYVLFCMHDMRNSYLECMCWMRLLLPSVPREKFSEERWQI